LFGGAGTGPDGAGGVGDAFSALALGVFLSVFLLTRTGLSYLTRDAFGGIMLFFKFVFDKEI